VSSPPLSQKNNYIRLKADTGATSTFLHSQDLGALSIKPYTTQNPPIDAIVPSGHIIRSQGHTHLPVPQLPLQARIAHVMPKLASGSLLSVGTVCDAHCTAIFDANSVKIYKTKHITIHENTPPFLQGTRTPPHQPLYSIPVPTSLQTPSRLNATIHNPSIRNRVAFYHAALFSPTISTWLRAHKNNNLSTWPALTAAQIAKYGPLSRATILGHSHAHRSNIRSTKNPKTGPLPLTYTAAAANAEDISPDPCDVLTNNIFVADINVTGRTFSDQTGRFICPSLSGNNYVFVLYNYDTNSIHPIAIPNRKKESLLKAMKTVTTQLHRRGFQPKLHKMDNEISDLMKEYLQKERINFELTPTGLHRRNLAERAIQTFKNHFIAGLCSTHPDFPLNLWDQLLPQCELTLNLLRSSHTTPHLSAHAHLNGLFNYNSTPLAPPGMKVLIHERPLERGSTWSPHNTEAWYLGPATDHYRQHRVWVPATGAVRVVDTITWLPHNIHMPTSTAEDIIIAAANDLSHALQQSDQNPLLPPLNTQTRTSLMQLQKIFSDRFANPLKDLPSQQLPNTAQTYTSSTPVKLPRVASPPIPIPKPVVQQPRTSSDFRTLSTTLKTL
jgi:hypothetical protein